ncbi:MAG: uracil-DNA glycosylase [Pirellulaceae bacterium]
MPSVKNAKLAWDELNQAIEGCRRCPRLVKHCQTVAAVKRAAYVEEAYWGKPVPNFGSAGAKVLIVGLAPGAHGANRTGRMFTGDRSGEWLFRALHRAGLAKLPSYQNTGDGQQLIDCAITAVCHCAPPANKPRPEEITNCQAFLERTWSLTRPQVVLTLGQIAWSQTFQFAKRNQWWQGPIPRFGHGAAVRLRNNQLAEKQQPAKHATTWVVGSFHPSQQNTFTGRLTEKMLDSVLAEVCKLKKNQ